MIDAGVDSLLGGVLGSIRSVVAGAEVGGLDAVSAARLVEECGRVLAAAIVDEDDRHRRVHRSRHVRSWVDRHGVGRLSATMTPDALARFVGEVDRRCNDIVDDAIRGGWFESRDAHRADALLELTLPDVAAPAGPRNMVHVVVDYDALM